MWEGDKYWKQKAWREVGWEWLKMLQKKKNEGVTKVAVGLV